MPKPSYSAGVLSRAALALVAFFVLSFAVATAAETLAGQVIGITDGDTITVLVAERPIKVRLAEIDTPERGQPWATRSKQALSDKVFRKRVEVPVVETDCYGRTVGHVWLGDRHVNREVVREGHAWVYRKYLKDETLLEDEAHAREAEIGLWGLSEAQRVPPWEWRKGERGSRSKKERSAGQSFTCGTKRYCREMGSCAEARCYLAECGLTRLDGDGDSVPCESICQ